MIWYVVTLTILALILIVCMFKSVRSDKHDSKGVLYVLLLDLSVILCNIILGLTSNEKICSIVYVVLFISVDFLLYNLIRFSMPYCGFEFKGTWYKWIMKSLAILDSLSLALNPVLHHAMEFEKVNIVSLGNYEYCNVVAGNHYIVHLVVSAFLFIQIVIIFAHRIAISSKYANDRYMMLFTMFLLTGVLEVAYELLKLPPNYSMIGYGLVGIFVYYYSIQYVPTALLERMKSTIVSTVNEGILFFDEYNRCIYANSAAKLIFDVRESTIDSRRSEYTEVYDLFYELMGEDNKSISAVDNKSFEAKTYSSGELAVYDIQYHSLHDGAGKRMGAFARIRNITEAYERNEKYRLAATHDSLTGIYNRQGFFDTVQQRIEEDPDTVYYAIGSDVKEFKLVNDRYGKEVGDAILKRIAKTIEDHATARTIYGRLGGDRFGMFIRKEDYDEEMFLRLITEIPTIEVDTQYPIVIHLGVYEVDENIPVPVMFDRTFMAISEIKDDMDTRIAHYDGSIREDLIWEQKIVGNLDKAIREGNIIPYLQAQVQADGSLTGAEVLVRWRHPEDGMLPPGKFISILEKNSMIAKLDKYMWECACRILRKWKEDGRGDLYLSVNISPKDFYLIDVVGTLKSLTQVYGVDPASLRLEITESMMMDDVAQKIKTIQELRDFGFIVEMDDFGSGYSSLNMLKDMPVDILKLDMGFLSSTSEEKKLEKIVDVIISLAHDLGMEVVAEGVETHDQVTFLSSKKCETFQGYYYSRPVGLEEFKIS